MKKLLEDDLFIHWILSPTAESDRYWHEKINEEPELGELIEEIKTLINKTKVREKVLSAQHQSKLWKKIEQATMPQKRSKRLSLPVFLRYAAVVCLLLGIGFYWQMKEQKGEETDYQSILSKVMDEEELSEKILIVLGENDKIEVEEKDVEVAHDTEGNISIRSENEKIEKKQTAETQLNRLYVPYGKKMTLTFNDGTKAWINSGTRVVYPSVFAENSREIFVDGEIYLEVTPDKKKPFLVKTDQLEINVLGTSFNISAYKNDMAYSVVLVSGAVDVKKVGEKQHTLIQPDQKYTYEKTTGDTYLQQVDVHDYICWKEGILRLKKEQLSNIFKRLERYYNIPLAYNSQIADQITISGKLDLKESIQETFRILSTTTPIEYKINENEIEINVKP
ncbi:FecR family protein [Parabacteroides sp. OttesenSCG-928-J18]|nr:FecR family protein [Parabacteroides sp. OttesenSCG-928-J18]